MRIWDIDLVTSNSLPRLQLQSQWRELLAIKRKIDKCGMPNHGLVNNILNYNIRDFKNYTKCVYDAMIERDIKANINVLNEILIWKCDLFNDDREPCRYEDWLDGRWLETSIYNLQEKAICGMIPYDEWLIVADRYSEVMDEYLWRKI